MVDNTSKDLNLDSINVNQEGKLQSLIEAIWFLQLIFHINQQRY